MKPFLFELWTAEAMSSSSLVAARTLVSHISIPVSEKF